MERITIATFAAGPADKVPVLLMADSIRAYGAGLSDLKLRVYTPSYQRDVWAKEEEAELRAGGIMLVPFEAREEDLAFVYSIKPMAAMAAERDAGEGTLIWMDRHMLVMGTFADLLLEPYERLAYRPVNLKIFGQTYDGPISGMWKALYDLAGVPRSADFPMTSTVDRQVIHPYFFACHFASRAECGLMQRWHAIFRQAIDDPAMQPFLENKDHCVYLHQMALAAAVLSQPIEPRSLRELSQGYGYPIHLHNEMPKAYRSGDLACLNTAFLSPYYNGKDMLPEGAPIAPERLGWLKKYYG